MIEENAQVVAAEGEFVWVETRRQSTCGGCAANKGCGTSALAKVLGNKLTRVRALNQGVAQVGDQVVIGIDEQALVRGSLAIYLMPLAGLLLGAVVGALLSTRLLVAGEGLTIGLGVIGLLLGLVWVRGFTHRIHNDSRYQPVVIRRFS